MLYVLCFLVLINNSQFEKNLFINGHTYTEKQIPHCPQTHKNQVSNLFYRALTHISPLSVPVVSFDEIWICASIKIIGTK